MKTDSYIRPQTRLAPSPTAESKTFWTGGRDNRLLPLPRLRTLLPSAWSRLLAVPQHRRSTRAGLWTGTVAAYTVNRQPWIPGLDPPYIVAMVELADEPDVRLITNVVDASVDDIRVGLPVKVCVLRRLDGDVGRRGQPGVASIVPTHRVVTNFSCHANRSR